MRKVICLIPILLASACGESNTEQVRAKPEPLLIAAAQSASLEFPLHFGRDENPPGYTKVEARTDRGDNEGALALALVRCSPNHAWIESTSHTVAIIMPSEKNVIWRGVKFFHPSNQQIIECVRNSVREPFFYREITSGIDAYKQ